MSDTKRLRDALEFYADPFAWKKKHDHDDTLQVPDFYSELDFGGVAKRALADDAPPHDQIP